MVTFYACYALCLLAILVGSGHVLAQRTIPWKNKLLLLVFPASQLYLIWRMFTLSEPHQEILRAFTLISILAISMICAVSTVMLTTTIIDRARKKQKATQLAIEKESFEKQKSEMVALESDLRFAKDVLFTMNAHIAQAESYLANDESSNRAAREIEEAIGEFDRKSGGYCGNRVVDAVLSNKAAECDKEGIALVAKANLPAHTPVSGTELCAIVSNSLDNSIRACMELPRENRWISFSLVQKANMFVLKVDNPYNEKSFTTAKASLEDPFRMHGWGLSIIEQFAERHNGTVITTQNDGVFSLDVTLLLESASDDD